MDTNRMSATASLTPNSGGQANFDQPSTIKKMAWLRKKNLALMALPMAAVISFMAFSGASAPDIPVLSLSSDPLYASAAGDKPALALALSVEFPTVGAQYVKNSGDSTDDTYSNDKEYLGYYDAESCYTYNNAPTETPASPLTASDYKRFDRSGPAIALATPDATQKTKTSRMCADAFSGNFLNWASNSAIDMLRLAMTGGDRYIDTAKLTILQRAVLPDGDPTTMWNNTNFPAKKLLKSGGSSGAAYFGAVPLSMRTDAGSNDIWVANTLNRIYFGAKSTGMPSSSKGDYVLGVSAPALGTIVDKNVSLPSGTTLCAAENATCGGFSGIKEIWYGAGSKWKVAPATVSVSCSNGVFGDPISGTSKQCYYRTYTGTWTPPSTTGLTSDPFYYSRVQVCNTDTSGTLLDARDYKLCTQYPNGNYKPTGTIQKYSDQLRLAAFGYLMDQTASYDKGRYGGVLRAPIKYVGSNTFDENGVDNTVSGGNPNREWDVSTGVFIPNPDGNKDTATSSGTYLSGVISYLNQFGRTGPVAGRYKKYDPVGELHYEVLRYLQGLTPSADAIKDITSDMYDGFPVSTTWTDPYGGSRSKDADYSCQKSNIVVIGDIHTHDGNRLPTANINGDVPDINAWRTVVQNFEKNVSSDYVDGQGVTRKTGNPNGANTSVPTDTKTSQIMGSAYWAHTHDIRGTCSATSPRTCMSVEDKQRPGLRVKTFLFDVNEYGNETDANHRHYQNQFFMASKYGGFETDAANKSTTYAKSYNTKGNPFYQDDLTTVDNYVWSDTDTRASRVGEANTYFLQSDARAVLSAFDDIFSRASNKARSIAGSAAQSRSLTTVGNTVYQGAFDTSDWSGDLMAYSLTVSAGTVSISADPIWKAATQLTRTTSRNIYVGKTTVGTTDTTAAIPFTWAAVQSTDLATSLDKPSPTATSDGRAEERLNYLRGDNKGEGDYFRKRNQLLGDIINSGVAYSGNPTTSISSSSYADFYRAQIAVPTVGDVVGHAARTPAVFVGANDGMLHAFNANTGDELFAYIPSKMGPNLSALTNIGYVNAHQSYVDATPTVAEAQTGTAGTAADWKTVLVGGMGGGGQGVFALDVTNPAPKSTTNTTGFDESKVMWEFTNDDDADMGYVVGRPQILKLRTSAYGATTTTYKWFAVVASGVNSYAKANTSNNFGTGYPALFLLDLAKPIGTSWSLGSNYYKISLPVNGTLDYLTTGSLTSTSATGAINFKAALGNALEVTQIYMGDLQGNLWKLDFSMAGTADWNIGKLSAFNKGTSTNPIPYPLFIAKDGSGKDAKVQPITMAPSIAFGPTADSSLILFGTGKFLESTDKTSTSQQSVYMLYDSNTITGGDSSPVGASAISGRGRLRAGTSSGGVISVQAFTMGRAKTDTDDLTVDTTVRSGWYFDFGASGERQISGATIVGTTATFGSLIPIASGGGTCGNAKGGGNTYTVNIVSGNGKSTSSSVGILGEPLLVELSESTTSTVSDSTGRRTKTTTSQVIQQGSTGLATGSKVVTTSIAGRLSWRQINNYQDLK